MSNDDIVAELLVLVPEGGHDVPMHVACAGHSMLKLKLLHACATI